MLQGPRFSAVKEPRFPGSEPGQVWRGDGLRFRIVRFWVICPPLPPLGMYGLLSLATVGHQHLLSLATVGQ